MEGLFARHGLRYSAYLLFDFMTFALGFVLAYHLLSHDYYLGALILSIFLAGRWNGIGVLMHECVHLTAFKTKKYNIWAGEIIAPLLLMDFRRYQASHLHHHSNLNNENDPDKQKYLYYHERFRLNRKSNLIAFILAYPLIYLLIKPRTRFRASFKTSKQGKDRGRLIYPALLQGGIVLLFAQFQNMLLFLAVTAYLSLVMKNMREIFEHHLLEGQESRSFFNGDILLANTIYRHNIGFHALHHRYPGIPFYRLPDAEKIVPTRTGDDINHVGSLLKILWMKDFQKDVNP